MHHGINNSLLFSVPPSRSFTPMDVALPACLAASRIAPVAGDGTMTDWSNNLCCPGLAQLDRTGLSCTAAALTDSRRGRGEIDTHMDDLAALADSPRHESLIKRHAAQIAQPLGLSNQEAEMKLNSLLRRHRDEWHAFVESLGADSFIRQWTGSVS